METILLPTSHPSYLPACLSLHWLPPRRSSHLPSSPLCAAVLGRGGAGQGALHARAGEVPEDRSLQAFQEEGPGEAEGQAEQGRWGWIPLHLSKHGQKKFFTAHSPAMDVTISRKSDKSELTQSGELGSVPQLPLGFKVKHAASDRQRDQ